MAVKNNVDVFYFACVAPMHVFFTGDGQMEKKVFLATWRDIPSQNEVQYTLEGIECNADGVSSKMLQNNVFTVAKRNLEGQDMVYQSIKFCNNVWALAELKISPGNPTITVSLNLGSMIPRNFEDQYLSILGQLHGHDHLIRNMNFFQLALKSRAMDVCQGIYEMYNAILRN